MDLRALITKFRRAADALEELIYEESLETKLDKLKKKAKVQLREVKKEGKKIDKLKEHWTKRPENREKFERTKKRMQEARYGKKRGEE